MPPASYALALGSNRRTRHGDPARTLHAAVAALDAAEIAVVAASPVIVTRAMGPAGRGFANAAVLVSTALEPPALLAALKRIERAFGRRPGRRWGARPLDLDILLWVGGRWPRAHAPNPAARLVVPHRALAVRAFVLDPLFAVARDWRTPDGPSIRHLAARLRAPRPVDRRQAHA